MQRAENGAHRLRALVIGYGNPLRGDDGFGPEVAERLQATLSSDTVLVIACQQLTPELAEPISRADTVVFVDARLGEPTGVIEHEPVHPASPPFAAMAHHAEPAGLLALAQELYGATPKRAFLLTVRTVHFRYDEHLSPEAHAATLEAMERIRQILAD